jgi:hypothetical protein
MALGWRAGRPCLRLSLFAAEHMRYGKLRQDQVEMVRIACF